MGKGWGLTLDYNPIEFSSNKTTGFGSTIATLDSCKGTMVPSGTDFPVNLIPKEDHSPPSLRNQRPSFPVGEVDFFANSAASAASAADKKTDDTTSSNMAGLVVKKENYQSHDIKPPHSIPRFHVYTGLNLLTSNAASDQSTVDDGISSDAEEKRAKNELAQLHVELERINSENQRLKEMLTQVTNNYSTLHAHLTTLMQQNHNSTTEINQEHQSLEKKMEKRAIVPRQFLELGPSATAEKDEPSHSSSEERTISGSPISNKQVSKNHINISRVAEAPNDGREDSPDSESWVPSKLPKLNPPETSLDQATEASMKKARVSVRARSEAPMITDGCQWRKYGQKMAKGNPCPRAYYRCTMAVGCPVRKQVQRCAEDRSILITTYEGTHNHPLPAAAMAMASTTASAANMLLSGSMSSADGLMNPNFLARAILPCSSSVATISASAPFPTVTLDLTQSPNPLQFQRSPAMATPFQVPFPAGQPQAFAAALPNSPSMSVFGQALYNQSKFSGLHVSNHPEMEPKQAVPVLQSGPPHLIVQGQDQASSFADTLSAATAAITSDPNFTAALAAAISSIINGGSQNGTGNSNSPAANGNLPTTSGGFQSRSQ